MNEKLQKYPMRKVSVCTKYVGIPTYGDNQCIVTLAEHLVNGIAEFLKTRQRKSNTIAAPVACIFGNIRDEYPLLTMESVSGDEKYTPIGEIRVYVDPVEQYRGWGLTGLCGDVIRVKVNYVSDDAKPPKTLDFELCSQRYSCQDSSYWKWFDVELN